MILKTDRETFGSYLTDASNFKGDADLLIIPESSSEVPEAINIATSHNLKITVSGAGTGLCGGRVPQGGAVISTEKLKHFEIDAENKKVIAEPGVLFSELETELLAKGLFLPPGPTEKNSSIGGNVSTNASGANTFKYGPFRYFVTALEVVLAGGEILKITDTDIISGNTIRATINGVSRQMSFRNIYYPAVKNASGYYFKNGSNLCGLFTGSEGTLGFISKIELKLTDLPEHFIGGIVFFDATERMLAFVESVRTKSMINNRHDYRTVADISARLIEYFDKYSIAIIRDKYPQLPYDIAGAVWFDQETTFENESKVTSLWWELITKYTGLADYTWFANDDSGHEKLKTLRHSIPETVNEIVSRNGFRKIGTDNAVPDKSFPEFYNYIYNELNNLQIPYAVWGHFGNSHIHANLMPRTQSEFESGLHFYNRVNEMALALGGTVSAEHGIGKIKKDYLLRMYGDESIKEMINIKKFFDPLCVFGEGNLFML